MPSCSMAFSSSTSNVRPLPATMSPDRRANSRGVSELPGSLQSSRARLLHSPSSRPRRTASENADAPAVEVHRRRQSSTRERVPGGASLVL